MGIDKKSYLLGLEKVFDISDTNLFNANLIEINYEHQSLISIREPAMTLSLLTTEKR